MKSQPILWAYICNAQIDYIEWPLFVSPMHAMISRSYIRNGFERIWNNNVSICSIKPMAIFHAISKLNLLSMNERTDELLKTKRKLKRFYPKLRFTGQHSNWVKWESMAKKYGLWSWMLFSDSLLYWTQILCKFTLPQQPPNSTMITKKVGIAKTSKWFIYCSSIDPDTMIVFSVCLPLSMRLCVGWCIMCVK